MESYKKYTFSIPQNLPIEDCESPQWPGDELIESLGWDPTDEELTIAQLSEDWNGHKKGAQVILGLTVEGHPFAVENTDNEAI